MDDAMLRQIVEMSNFTKKMKAKILSGEVRLTYAPAITMGKPSRRLTVRCSPRKSRRS